MTVTRSCRRRHVPGCRGPTSSVSITTCGTSSTRISSSMRCRVRLCLRGLGHRYRLVGEPDGDQAVGRVRRRCVRSPRRVPPLGCTPRRIEADPPDATPWLGGHFISAPACCPRSRSVVSRRSRAGLPDPRAVLATHRVPEAAPRVVRRCGLGCVPGRGCLQLAGWIRTCSWCHATFPSAISWTTRSLLRALAMTARQGLFVRRCISAAWLRARSASWRSPV